MQQNAIFEKSFEFAVRIVKLYKYLTQEHKEFTLSKQLLKSGTSIGANVAEAQRGQSKADFTAKMCIALKEANETGKWLEMLYLTKKIDGSRYKKIAGECATIRILLIASLKTAKANAEKNASNQNL